MLILLEAAHHVLPRDDLASFRIDVLLFQPVARFRLIRLKLTFSLREEAE
jgi:hypothetical protein